MRMTGRILAIAVALALLAPSAALAQSAGDEQYSDPFQDVPSEDGGGQNDNGTQGGGNQGGGDQGGSQTAAPPAEPAQPVAPAEPVAPQGSASTAVPPTAAGGDGVALPRTGLPVALLALFGMFMVAGGAALRRAT